MATEHNILTDPELHEPKGVAAASVKEVYVADGAGSGVWAYPPGSVYGEMLITNNSTGQALTAAGDSTLATDGDYVKLTGAWTTGAVDGITFSTDQLTVPVAGNYELSFWASLQAPNNAVIGFKYAINNSTPYSVQKVKRKAGSVSDVGSIAASGIVVSLSASDIISLYIASDTTGTTTVTDAGLICKLIKDGRL